MHKLDKQYQDLLKTILEHGVDKEDRTETGTLSVFGRQIRHKMSDGFPLLTTKKMAVKAMVTELKWFLKGDTNIKYLVENGCNIWNGDAYKNYRNNCKPNYGDGPDWMRPEIDFQYLTEKEFIDRIKGDDGFARIWGELGPIYGKQWRKWNKVRFRDIQRVNQHPTQIMGVENPFEEEGKWVRGYEDQIQNLINELKTNPDSRRLMVSAWNVSELDRMTLPPCHYGFQMYTRELSHDERFELYKKVCGRDLQAHITGINFKQFHFDEFNVPTRAISLMWNQRSVDTFLGLPFNIASYGLLLELIAKEVNMVPDELIGNLGDTHLYSNHIEQAKEQIGRLYTEEERQYIFQTTGMDAMSDCNKKTELYSMVPNRTREPYDLPTIKLSNVDILNGEFDYEILNYQSHPSIKAPLSN